MHYYTCTQGFELPFESEAAAFDGIFRAILDDAAQSWELECYTGIELVRDDGESQWVYDTGTGYSAVSSTVQDTIREALVYLDRGGTWRFVGPLDLECGRCY